MILKYNYWYFKSAIPPYICNQIIEAGITAMSESEKKHGAAASIASTGDWKQKISDNQKPINANSISALKKKGLDFENAYVRDSNVSWLNDIKIYEMLWPFVRQANESAGWNFEWDYTEDLQFTKYGAGQFYGWHTDTGAEPYKLFDPKIDEYHKNPDGTPATDSFGNPLPEKQFCTDNPKLVGKIRKLSMTVSLNDSKEYSGGNLRFDLGPHRKDRYHTCKEIRPQGSIVVFPSYMYHQVTPVTRGTRYSLVAWNLGKPFR